MLPSIEYITELKGDLEGYILNLSSEKNKNFKEISVIYNQKRYVMLVLGFSKEEILEILNTFIVED